MTSAVEYAHVPVRPVSAQGGPDIARDVQAQRWDPADVVRVLLQAEVVGQDAATFADAPQKMRNSRPLVVLVVAAGGVFDSRHRRVRSPREWVHLRENLAVAGVSGTGMSHFVEALAHATIEADPPVLWFNVETLTRTVNKAEASGQDALDRTSMTTRNSTDAQAELLNLAGLTIGQSQRTRPIPAERR